MCRCQYSKEGSMEKGPNRQKDWFGSLLILFLSALRKTTSLAVCTILSYFIKIQGYFYISIGGVSCLPLWLQSRPCWRWRLQSIYCCTGQNRHSRAHPGSISGCVQVNPVSTSCLMGFFFLWIWSNLTHERLSVCVHHLSSCHEANIFLTASNFPRSVAPSTVGLWSSEYTSLHQTSFTQVTQSCKTLICQIPINCGWPSHHRDQCNKGKSAVLHLCLTMLITHDLSCCWWVEALCHIDNQILNPMW